MTTTTTANTMPSPTCVGYALYLELEKGTMVTQVLIMPEGVSSTHREVNLSLYRRRLTQATPRRTWRQAVSPARSTTLTTIATDPVEMFRERAGNVSGFIALYLCTLAENDWKVRNTMITVEVTAEDLEDARLGKTPYKVFGRVWKVRKKIGFPKEFLVGPAGVPTY